MKFWLFLAGAIAFEVCGTTCMKLSEGFTRLTSSVLIWVFYALSLTSATFALKGLNLGIAYAIWCAMGIAIMATIGILHFKEPATILKFVSFALVIAGVIGLSLSQSQR